ncbi:MAG: hypothetical protein ACO3EP_02505, partial [Phycisphaerales bacterium]
MDSGRDSSGQLILGHRGHKAEEGEGTVAVEPSAGLLDESLHRGDPRGVRRSPETEAKEPLRGDLRRAAFLATVNAGEGVDTVYSNIDYQGGPVAIPEGVESFIVEAWQSAPVTLTAAAGGSTLSITGSTYAGNNNAPGSTLVSGTGDDILVGASDTSYRFSANFGHDSVRGGGALYFDFPQPDDLRVAMFGSKATLVIGNDRVTLDYYGDGSNYQVWFANPDVPGTYL